MPVLVIGGGAVGLCVAYFLRQAGREVTVLSRDPVGEGASAGNAGMIVPSHVVPLAAPGVVAQGLRWLTRPDSPFFIQPRLDLDLARWLWTFRRHCTPAHVARAVPVLRDLSLASVELFAQMQQDIGDVGYAQAGLLMLYHSEKGRKENLAAADRAEAAGLEIERLDAEAARVLEPEIRTPLEGAVLYRQDGRVDPDLFLQKLADTLRESGVSIHDGAAVQGFAMVGGQVTGVRTMRGTMQADEVVLAAGAWTGRLARDLGLRVQLQPAKGYSLTCEAPTPAPRLPMILSEEKLTVTPLPNRLRFAGTLALSGFDPSIDPRRAAPILALAHRYLPETAQDDQAPDVWAGFRPCSPDGLPLVGRSPRHANVTVATGHGMMGLTLAPITGLLVAQMLSGGRPAVDLAPLRLDRF